MNLNKLLEMMDALEYLAFFEKYIISFNEIDAMIESETSYETFKKYQKSKIYIDIKKIIDEYKIQEVENGFYALAMSGNIKAAEFIIKNKSKNFVENDKGYSDIATEFLDKI